LSTTQIEAVMPPALFATTTVPLTDLNYFKMAAAILFLAFFWCWETWRPFSAQQEGRARHALHNLAVALFNTVILGLTFGFVTAAVAGWTESNQLGLLNALAVPALVRFGLALVLLDGWMYAWHRANHTIPALWRFHRVHHSDRRMDVTTATRFHVGEHVGSSVLRLGLIPLLGLELWNLVVYDTLVIAIKVPSCGYLPGPMGPPAALADRHAVHAQGPPLRLASRNRLELFVGAVHLGPACRLISHEIRSEHGCLRPARFHGQELAELVGDDEDPVCECHGTARAYGGHWLEAHSAGRHGYAASCSACPQPLRGGSS
jgi:sterol desaturase/sphingolipid hydroxylase (fatty acid hydroxylase superfamily)